MARIPEDTRHLQIVLISSPWLRGLTALVVITVVIALHPGAAVGFPPYRSTDADTADAWVLEARLGLLSLTRDADDTSYTTPLLRLNYGFPHKLEILSEFEFSPDDRRLAEAAVGFKWIPFSGSISVGLEALVLLPVTTDSGLGAEGVAIATWRNSQVRLHVNAGGFRDARGGMSASAWKSGLLGEVELARFRPGLELAGKQVESEDVALQAGGGVIVDVGPLDLRMGLHVGLTDRAPDIAASLWVTRKLSTR